MIDKDNPTWGDKEFAEARPAREVLPKKLFNALVANQKKGRGPGKKPAKILTSVRLDPEVHAYYKEVGTSQLNIDLSGLVKGRLIRSAAGKIIAKEKVIKGKKITIGLRRKKLRTNSSHKSKPDVRHA